MAMLEISMHSWWTEWLRSSASKRDDGIRIPGTTSPEIPSVVSCMKTGACMSSHRHMVTHQVGGRELRFSVQTIEEIGQCCWNFAHFV